MSGSVIQTKIVTTQVPKTTIKGLHCAGTTHDTGATVTKPGFNRRVHKGTRRENKRLNALRSSAPTAVIVLAIKYRIAIGRPINIPE
ncbi:MAG: hypothetical protein C5S47_00980 [Candidatus Methanogasteraceae archaeon]|nr:MAG: hypothetical protein C5S47_00980 [ANME-2 cluster archaeon]